MAKGDFRSFSPQFQRENSEAYLKLIEALDSVAAHLNATTAQVVSARVAAQGSDIVPIVGARRRDRLKESLGAFNLTLSADDLKAVEASVPRGAAAGDRYPPHMAALLKLD